MKKITKATFKSFIKKNEGKLFFQRMSNFDGMTDCVEFTPSSERKFIELKKKTISDIDYFVAEQHGNSREELENRIFNSSNTLGYHGIWLVNGSDDRFKEFENDQFQGISVNNCCGSFIVAIQKQKVAA